MSFFSNSNGSSSAPKRGSSGLKPFSIDDAFDIPEDDDDLDYASDKANSNSKAKAPIIRNGQLRLSSEGGGSAAYQVGNGGGGANANGGSDGANGNAGPGAGGGDGSSTADSASLIQSGSGGGDGEGALDGGYYSGPPTLKYWWLHPKVRSNPRVVIAACMLVILGLGLIACGIVVYCIPDFKEVQGVVFIIAGIICFVPGAYHIVYVYLAVKGKRGFEFNHLPLFNN